MGWFKKLTSKVFDDVLGFDPNGGGIYGVARDVLGDKIADDILGFDPHGGGSVKAVNTIAPIILAAVAGPAIASGISSLAGTTAAGAAGAGAAGAGAAELASLAEIAGGAGGLGTTAGTAATLADIAALTGAGAAGAGIAGLTDAALGELGINTALPTDLASMGIDPAALASYGGDVASNIGAGSSGLGLSDVTRAVRAANTASKILGGGDEKSRSFDPKTLAALGSLVGMGIGGSSGAEGIPKYSFTREVLPIDTARRPGSAAQRYFKDSYTKLAAGGGIAGLKPNEYKAGGRYLSGPGDGMSDNIKANIDGMQEARLADGEFVIPADVVSHIGNGSSNAGAKKLHKMMDRIRHARTGNPKQGKQIKAEKFLPA